MAQFTSVATPDEGCIGDPWMQIIPPVYGFSRGYSLLTPDLTHLSVCEPIHYLTIIITESAKDGVLVDKENMDTSEFIPVPRTDLVYQTIEIRKC